MPVGWHDSLANGIVPNTAASRIDVALRPDAANASLKPASAQPLSLLLRPDPHVWDGRFNNNAWLQELPRPLTKLTWDNPLLIAPAQAQRLGVGNGDRVTLSVGQISVTLPAWIMPGQADNCVVGLLGFGRRVVGTVGEGTGFDLYPPGVSTGSGSLAKAKGSEVLASTEHHNPMLATPDDFARHGTLAQFQAEPRFLADKAANQELYRWKPPGPAQWGMSIDLNACIGCNACVVACMAENNIPVVGKQEVIREREMHWLRIDRYYDGKAEDPGHPVPAGPLHALRGGALRICLPGRRHCARQRRPERDGLQPLHRHAVLLQQLPLQGAPLQLLRFHRPGTSPAAGAQPGSDCARTRRHGEMHVLPATYRRGPHRRGYREPSDRRRRSAHCLPGRLPDAGHSPSATWRKAARWWSASAAR